MEIKTVKHTSTPWEVWNGNKTQILQKNSAQDWRVIADCQPEYFTGERKLTLQQAMDNAEFIVTACNAHEELVAACKEAWSFAPDMEDGSIRLPKETVLKLEQALAKAGVKAEGKE